MTARISVGTVGVALALALGLASQAHAQGRGGRGGGSNAPSGDLRSRMDILSDTFTLDKDQKKQIKATLDEEYKAGAPIRAALKTARAALYAALAGGQSAEIDKAIQAYAAQATAMTDLEMRALAHILTPLRAEQRAQGTMGAFYLMRSIFLDDKKWDEVPKVREY